MKELNEILKVQEKTENVLLLKVKEGAQLDLIAHGFEGNESLFRLMKWKRNSSETQKSYTTFYGDDFKSGSTFCFGDGSITLGTDDWVMQRDKIREVAKKYFNFDI